MDIIDLLAGDSYIIYNKDFARYYGIENAVLLGAMCSYQKGFKNEEFYREQDKILYDTALTLYGLRNATKKLQELKILKITKKGLPAKYYYQIDKEVLEEMFKSISTRPYENDSTGHNQNNSTNNKNNNKNNNEEKKERKTTYEMLLEELEPCIEVRNEFIEFIKMRKLIKKPMTDLALKKMINKLHNMTSDTNRQIKILEQSIINDWQDIYDLKEKQTPQKSECKYTLGGLHL